MALATLAPSVTKPGLSARMSSLSSALGALVADLDPGLLLGSDAASLYGDFCALERLVTAGKTLLAPRIEESGWWETDGHRSAAGLLATLEGGSTGNARRTLEAGRALSDLPGTEAALRQGSLSGSKLTEVTQAGSLDPDNETSLLAGIDTESLQVIKERCQQLRATSTTKDPLAALSRIHATRSFTSWNDAEGAFCFSGRDTPERGAALLARLIPVAKRLGRDRRAAATEAARDLPKGSPTPRPEEEKALRADALFLLVTRRRSAPPGASPGSTGSPGSPGSPGSLSSNGSPGSLSSPGSPGSPGSTCSNGSTGSTGTKGSNGSTGSTGTKGSSRSTRRSGSTATATGTRSTGTSTGSTGSTDLADLTDPADPDDLGDLDLGGAEDLVTAAPPATVIVRVDLSALRRGTALPGELCELDGQGPVPVKVAQSLMDDAFLALVFTEAGDIRSVAHRGRTINAHLRTALILRDRCCVVPGCGVAYGLEIDHVEPLESGGDTRLDNLALLCRHHHRLKTYDGWDLCRTGPSDDDPEWCFTPMPPFGQEPDLGLDRPPEPVPRK